MRFETILSLAAVAGVGYLLWERFGPTVQSGVYSPVTPPFGPAAGVIPAGTPIAPAGTITPDCQLPCPVGMQCAQALDGVRDSAGVCNPIRLRMN